MSSIEVILKQKAYFCGYGLGRHLGSHLVTCLELAKVSDLIDVGFLIHLIRGISDCLLHRSPPMAVLKYS